MIAVLSFKITKITQRIHINTYGIMTLLKIQFYFPETLHELSTKLTYL